MEAAHRERRWKIAGVLFGVLLPLACFLVNHYVKALPGMESGSIALFFKGAVGLGMLAMLLCLWQSGRSSSLVFLLGPPLFLGLLLAAALTYFLGLLGALALSRGMPIGLFGLCPPLTLIVFARWWWALMRTRRPRAPGILTSVVPNGILLAVVVLM